LSFPNVRIAILIAVAALAWGHGGPPRATAQQQISDAAAALYAEATQMISGGQYADAIDKLGKVIALEPKFARGHFDLGFCNEQLQEFTTAAAAYGKACEIEPDNTDACFGQAKAVYLAGDYATALETLSAMSATSEDPKVWIQLARTQKQLKLYDDASASAVKATELGPENAEAFFELGAIEYDRQRKAKQYDLAIEAYTNALLLDAAHGNAFAAHFKLGKMYYRTKAYTEATTHFTKALELRPDYAPAYIDLGNSRNKAGDAEGAIEAYNTAIELRAPEPYGMAYYSLGRLYWAQDDAEAAIAAYEQAITDPKFKHAAKAQEAIASIEDYLEKKRKASGVY
jgi:tetratricopeptide (TPR) repeat protein